MLAGMRHARSQMVALVASIAVVVLSAPADARVKPRFAHSYSAQISMLQGTSDAAAGTVNSYWNTTEGFVPACTTDYPDPQQRPSYVASVQAFESAVSTSPKLISTLAKNSERVLERDPSAHKSWFSKPAADAKVIDRGAHQLYIALLEDGAAVFDIETALRSLGGGTCDITKPMDEAHASIADAWVELGKAFKALRSLLP